MHKVCSRLLAFDVNQSPYWPVYRNSPKWSQGTKNIGLFLTTRHIIEPGAPAHKD